MHHVHSQIPDPPDDNPLLTISHPWSSPHVVCLECGSFSPDFAVVVLFIAFCVVFREPQSRHAWIRHIYVWISECDDNNLIILPIIDDQINSRTQLRANDDVTQNFCSGWSFKTNDYKFQNNFTWRNNHEFNSRLTCAETMH